MKLTTDPLAMMTRGRKFKPTIRPACFILDLRLIGIQEVGSSRPGHRTSRTRSVARLL